MTNLREELAQSDAQHELTTPSFTKDQPKKHGAQKDTKGVKGARK